MVQIEVTTRVNNKLSEIDNLLNKEGFKKIYTARIEDSYFSLRSAELAKDNILDILKSCVLIRYIKSENSEIRKLIYKNKKYESDIVLSEEKTSVGIDNINDAKELFKKLNYQGVVDVNYNTCIYSNLKDELAFQDVEGLGLLLEYENAKDFYLASANEILTEKSMMMMIIKNYGIDVTEDYDVKKAYELIKKRYK